MSILQRLKDPTRPGSLARRFRESRFAFFSELLSTVSCLIRLLDVGGTQTFWETMGFADEVGVEITLFNVTTPPGSEGSKFRFAEGDACSLHIFADGEFDVVFSNSVIEHVGDLGRCQKMADEVQRVGQRYFVQTPNRNFPIDPHFPFPFFQFYPIGVRARLLQTLPLAWVGRIRNPEDAYGVAQSVNLLTESELRSLFPGCQLYHEKLFGLTKSFVAYSGW